MRIASAVLLATVAAVGGCTVSDRKVSDDPHFRVGYLPGQVYRLARPVTLLRVDPHWLVLVEPPQERPADE